MIFFEGYWYTHIQKFNGKIIDLRVDYDDKELIDKIKNKYNNLGCAGYFTVLPISDKEFRNNEDGCCSKQNVEVIINKNLYGWENYTVFMIFDDWGNQHTIYIQNIHKDEIEKAIESTKEQDIPIRVL
jgi:hypothetical protein